MTKREVAALICKSFSIYLFILVLNALSANALPAYHLAGFSPAFVGAAADNSTRITWFLTVLPIITNMIACLFLWICADEIAARMVKDSDPEAPSGFGKEWHGFVFSAIGLLTLLQGIPRIGQIVSALLIFKYSSTFSSEPPALAAPNIMAAVIQLLLGLWLLLGASGMVGLIKSFRTAGMDKQVP